MIERIRKNLPSTEEVRNSPWIRWLGPAIQHPRLWHTHRRGMAWGLALGTFFGIVAPVAQIPLSAAAAVALRANLPMAVSGTLLSNPITFGPIWYTAWKIGSAVLGDNGLEPPELTEAGAAASGWFERQWERLSGMGRPLLVGLPLLAAATGLLSYVLVSTLWTLHVRRKRRARLSARYTGTV